MSDAATSGDSRSEDETLFQQTVAQIGGQERIYLVSDVHQSQGKVEGDGRGLLQEFVGDMFHGCRLYGNIGQRCTSQNPHPCAAKMEDLNMKEIPLTIKRDGVSPCEDAANGKPQRTATREVSVYSQRRAIDFPVIVFLFRQTFVSKTRNHVCVKEILKDVKARARRTKRRPALIGLIHSRQEDSDTHQCLENLELLIRSVFRKHPAECIWVGCFLPLSEVNTLHIKRNISRVIKASQEADNTEDRGNLLSFPCRCWSHRGRANGSPSHEQRGDMQSEEESIPLKIRSSAAGPQEESAGVDS
ncbi:uncharacterized protein LOC128771077 isoform X1 [Synchiropus splendidus]|uniref:uncharacterized protein LOC128771077 isoform X1 n=1 Tax=Synchiropus splendidus TaxID=270530 RepID=UPI00237D4932|nr:uncharacterized protein LOC128771077 isoform X1 [Synchiropus splendidus]